MFNEKQGYQSFYGSRGWLNLDLFYLYLFS